MYVLCVSGIFQSVGIAAAEPACSHFATVLVRQSPRFGHCGLVCAFVYIRECVRMRRVRGVEASPRARVAHVCVLGNGESVKIARF